MMILSVERQHPLLAMGICPSRHVACKRRVEEEHGTTGNVQLVIHNLAGEQLSLTRPSACQLHEILEAIHKEWKIPILAQRLVLKDEVVSQSSGAIGRILGLPSGGEVELVCLRNQLSFEVQESLDLRLFDAVAASDYAEIAAALTDGAGPGVPDQDSKAPSAFLTALALKDREAEQMLWDAGVRTDQTDKSKTYRSLRQALATRSLPQAVKCLAHGADVNTWLRRGEGVMDTSGGTPLHALCAQHLQPGAASVVRLLCRMRADVNAGDSEGDSPLAHARYFGTKEIEQVLRQYGGKLRGPYYQFSFRR